MHEPPKGSAVDSAAPQPAAPATRVCVLIPTCNNAATIADVVRAVGQLDLPALVVDDGCSDDSASLAQEAGAQVIRHSRNRGKGVALLSGWRAAAEEGYSHAIAMDADGQHLSTDLPNFLAAIERQPEALWAGTRPETGENVPSSASFGRRFSDFMLWAAAADELAGERPDSQCGFRAYPLEAVLALSLRGERYELEMEVLVKAAWHGVPVRALPIRVYYPPQSERVTHFHKWADNGRIVAVYTRLMLMRLLWPLFRPRRRLTGPG